MIYLMDLVQNRRGTLTYSSKAGSFGKLQRCLKKYIFFKISQNMIERCTNRKKRKNKKYRNVKIFASAIIELFKEYC